MREQVSDADGRGDVEPAGVEAAGAEAAHRWELSPEELERVRRARSGRLGPWGAARVLLRSPQVVPELARTVAGAARDAVLASNSLISLLDHALVRSAVPDAAIGVGWYDAQGFLEALTPHLDRDAEVLELGCGGGRISREVAPLVGRLVCTDYSPAMIREAQDNLAAYPNVEVATTSGRVLSEFSDGAFSVVFGQGVLGYLNPNPLLALLDEVHRVLRPGGVCVFNFSTIDHPQDGHELLETVRRQAARRRLHGGTDRVYTAAQIEAMYTLVGLRPLPAPPGERPGARPGRVNLKAERPVAASDAAGR